MNEHLKHTDQEPAPEHYSKKGLKAYEDLDFLNSGDARAVRILAEYLEPLQRLRRHHIKDTVVFYGSARIKSGSDVQQLSHRLSRRLENADAETRRRLENEVKQLDHQRRMAQYYEDARTLAFKLTQWSLSLDENQRFIVCSGGGPGIMEAANRGAKEAGGPSVGMNISIPHEQYPNPYISENLSFEFHYFFMRKFWFVYLAKALIVFPGGFGTMDELFELLTLRQTQKVKKPITVLMYGTEYWNSVVDFNRMVEWGVIDQEELELFHQVDGVDDAFERLKAHFEREFVGKKQYLYL